MNKIRSDYIQNKDSLQNTGFTPRNIVIKKWNEHSVQSFISSLENISKSANSAPRYIVITTSGFETTLHKKEASRLKEVVAVIDSLVNSGLLDKKGIETVKATIENLRDHVLESLGERETRAKTISSYFKNRLLQRVKSRLNQTIQRLEKQINKRSGFGIERVGKNKYVGRFKNGLYEGYGTLTLANGDVFKGYFHRGKVKEGSETAEGVEIFSGQFNGKKISPDGTVHKGHFVDGIATNAVIVYANKLQLSGGSTYRGALKNGVMHGKGRLERENEEIFDGHFENGVFKYGIGKLLLANGVEYRGKLKGELPHGQGNFIENDGDVITGEFKNGKLIQKGKTKKKDEIEHPDILVYKDRSYYIGKTDGKRPHGLGILYEIKEKAGKSVLKQLSGRFKNGKFFQIEAFAARQKKIDHLR